MRPTPSRSPGDRIADRYQVERPLRLGSAPEAWAAHTATKEAVTVFYFPDAATSEAVARSFLEEAPLLQGVTHRRLLAIDAIGIDAQGGVFVAAEPVKGQSLAAHLETVGALAYADATTVLCDALQGLSALHDRGLIHGGITSAEVLIERDAEGVLRGRLLADGMVGSLLRGASQRVGAARGRLYGSVHHLAPEQCRGEGTLPETDVWAMGVVMHEALMASLPFDGETPLEVIAAVLGEAPAALEDHVPAPLAEVVRRCLSKRAGDRLPDAESLCLALTVALESTRSAQAARFTVKPTPAKLQVAGVARGQAREVEGDDLDALIASVRAEQTPATGFELGFDGNSAPPAPLLRESLPELDFHRPEPAVTAAMPSGAAAIPGPSLPLPPVAVLPGSPPFADAAPPAEAPSPARESAVHTTLAVDTIDRTSAPIVRRPRAINPYLAFLVVAAVTGGLAWKGWRLSGGGGRSPVISAGGGSGTTSASPDEDPAADPAPDGGEPDDPTDPNAPRAEAQAPAEFGVQLSVPLPEGLAADATLQFVHHVVAAAPPDRASARGFASCTSAGVYLHAGGLDPSALRSGPVATRCDALDLALVPDLDGDERADLVAVDGHGDGIVAVGSRNLRSARRTTIEGALAVVGGLSRQDRRRAEPVVVVFAQPPGQGSALVAVGARTGRVVWRTVNGFSPALPKEHGLAVGPDADRDGVPDVVVGLVREGHRCVALLSGATGEPRWPAPRCFADASAQTLSLGPDLNGDGRAEVAVAGALEGRVRILSGDDGRDLRVISAAAPGEGIAFGISASLIPDLARDGFPDVALGRTETAGAAVEVYSANDAHRVGVHRVTTREPAGGAAIRIDYLEGFAFAGSRSLLVATTTGMQVIAAAERPEVRDQSAAP